MSVLYDINCSRLVKRCVPILLAEATNIVSLLMINFTLLPNVLRILKKCGLCDRLDIKFHHFHL